VSHLGALQQLGANSAGTLEALQNHNKSFGITQPERLIFVSSMLLWALALFLREFAKEKFHAEIFRSCVATVHMPP
jgi:hypothetical protein